MLCLLWYRDSSGFRELGFLKVSLASKDWGEKWILTAFGKSCVKRSPISFSNGCILIFFLLPMYTQKPFLLSLMFLDRLNSSWALSFLTSTLGALTMYLYSSQVTCPCFISLYASFLSLRLSGSSLFIHAEILPGFLLIGMDCSWAWRRWCLNINQLFFDPLFPLGLY